MSDEKKYVARVIRFGTFGQGFPDPEEVENDLNELVAEGRRVEILTIGTRGLLVLGTKPDPHPLASLFNREPPEASLGIEIPLRVVTPFAKLIQEFQRECQTSKSRETAAETVVQVMLKHVDLALAREVAEHLQRVQRQHAEQHPTGGDSCDVVKDFTVLHETLMKAINANVS